MPYGRGQRLAVTPDGRRAVLASYNQTLRVWNLESGQTLRSLEVLAAAGYVSPAPGTTARCAFGI